MSSLAPEMPRPTESTVASARAMLLPGQMLGATDPAQQQSQQQQQQQESDNKQLMTACVWEGKHKVAIRQVPRPTIVHPTDAIVRITATTICGSDLHLYHKALPGMRRGDVLGHECIGFVDEVGDGVADAAGPEPGQRVVVSFCLSCGGTCDPCSCGNTSQCLLTNPSKDQYGLHGHKLSGLLGYTHLTGGYAGAQAEYVRVPFAHVNCLPIPDELPDDKALFLADVVPTAYHSVVDLISATGGDEFEGVGGNWAIWGAGPIGILAAKFAFLVGKAESVIVIDRDAVRLRHVRHKIEGVQTINYTAVRSVPETIKRMTLRKLKGKGAAQLSSNVEDDYADDADLAGAGADYAIDATGGEYARSLLVKLLLRLGLATDTSETLEECMRSVKPFGAVGVIAEYTWKSHFFPVGTLMENGLRLVGNGQTPVHKYWKHLLNDFLLPGKLDPLDLIVTHRFRLEDTARAYALMDTHAYGLIKPLIQTPASTQGAEPGELGVGVEAAGTEKRKTPPLTPLL
ncbi:hypothetical protein OC842_001120 [Tilletia horrida]|uniref:Alcohol dehydrogenase-like N-terminal domain-containing protein n=1 Tax=Tilletia horrida TaxID=155126 RepID=A0AAN6GFN5_9BASI|nr:hypothetical protein OC842_001120 [Tilletia horrida]